VSPNRPHGTSWIWPATLVGRLGALLVTLIVVATGVAYLWDYRRDRDLAMERARRELQAQVDLVAERLRREIHDRHRSVDLWPELEAAQELAVDDLDRRLSASLLQLATSFGTGDMALGIGPEGTVLAASDASFIGMELAGSAYLLRLESVAPPSGEMTGLPLGPSAVTVFLLPDGREEGLPANGAPEDGRETLSFSHRVTGRADARPLGWIVLLTPWRELSGGVSPSRPASGPGTRGTPSRGSKDPGSRLHRRWGEISPNPSSSPSGVPSRRSWPPSGARASVSRGGRRSSSWCWCLRSSFS